MTDRPDLSSIHYETDGSITVTNARGDTLVIPLGNADPDRDAKIIAHMAAAGL